jgi:hypothetical protein
MYDELSQHVCDTMERQHAAADKTALEVRTLGPTEDLGDYANAQRVLTQRAYGHVYRPAQVEERAGEQFVRGLTGPLHQRVKEEFKEDLDSSLQYARNLEAVGVSRHPKAVALVAPEAYGSRPAVGAAWGPHNQGRGPANGSHGPQRPGGGQASQGVSTQGAGDQGARPKGELVCWYCNNKGHVKVDCRKKAAADAAARSAGAKNGWGQGIDEPPDPRSR